jgi:hypothetical protein
MLDLLFIDIETGKVNYAITDVTRVRYITPSEIGFDKGFNEDARSRVLAHLDLRAGNAEAIMSISTRRMICHQERETRLKIQRWRILALHYLGYPNSEIAQIVDCAESTVRLVIQRNENRSS